MKSGIIRTPVSCEKKNKVVLTFKHLIKQANCAGLAICSGPKLAVAFSCSRAKDTRKLKRSVDREIKLLRHHGLAGRRKRRR